MAENKSLKDTKEIVDFVIQGIQEKKGNEIVDLDLSKIGNAVSSNFIVCHGSSGRQVSAIADSIRDTVKKNTGELPWHTEGYQNAEWILMDYVNVVVHVFNEESRKFYNIEGLWADAEVKVYND